MSPRSSASQSSPEGASDGAPFAKVKRRLLKALRARGIARVQIEYDGEGDSGQIGEITAHDARGKIVALNHPIRLALRDGERPTRYGSLGGAIDDLAWTILGHYHDGFVNNDGGFGTISIDVAEATVTLDHNDRVVDSVNTTTQV